MQVEIPCEQCRVALRVPPEAAGHRARCPACGHTFVVPKVEQLLEETVSSWIEEDIEHLIEDRDREKDDERVRRNEAAAALAAAEAAEANGAGGSGGSGGTATAAPATHREHREPPRPQPHAEPHPHGRDARDGRDNHGGHGSARHQPPPPDRNLWPVRQPNQPAVPGGVRIPDDPPDNPAITSGDPDIEIITEPTKSHRASRPAEPRPKPAVEDADDHSDKKGKYPRNLHVDERVPHLVVQKVDAAGVHFAFDSQWLKHDGFRASLPMRCAFSGTTTRDKLIARPLVFMDRVLGSATTSLEQIVGAHENRTLGDHAPRDIARGMGMIESMPRPFAYAMPYYVAAKYSHLSLHCRTRDRISGGITCEVLVPDSACALDWLARVNGVCGEEYQLLEGDVSLQHGDAWQSLSDEARQRIEVWCKFQPREVMRHYFPDADFGRRDEGLAGLVVTDQRLVFCKYHHKGQVPIDAENATIVAKPEGRFASLTLRVGNDPQRMVKVHQNDLDRLTDALKSHGKIAVQVSD